MAYARTAGASTEIVTEQPRRAHTGFWSWFFQAMMESRQRQADREIARFLDNGKFTDEAEREIERRFLSTPPRF